MELIAFIVWLVLIAAALAFPIVAMLRILGRMGRPRR